MIFCFLITFFTLYLIIIFFRISRYIFPNLSVIEFDWDVPGETFVKTAGSLVPRKIVPRDGKFVKKKNITYCFFHLIHTSGWNGKNNRQGASQSPRRFGVELNPVPILSNTDVTSPVLPIAMEMILLQFDLLFTGGDKHDTRELESSIQVSFTSANDHSNHCTMYFIAYLSFSPLLYFSPLYASHCILFNFSLHFFL